MHLPQEITGIVKKSLQRGRELGYPTANMEYKGPLEDGVYASTVTINNTTHNALTFIGSSITFNEVERKMETYILDFSDDIYGKEISVRLEKYQRGNMKFDSSEALIEQIKQDEIEAREYFQK